MSERCEHDNPLCSACEAEIFSLRAEVERLTATMVSGDVIIEDKDIGFLSALFQRRWQASFERTAHERDAALAQVALFARKHPCCTHASPGQARALLDRLQRAEAVIEALDRCESNRGAFSCCEPHDVRCPKSRAASPDQWKGVWKCECGREQLDVALAAYRERV